MVYRTIGIMSGSSLDGLDIAFVEFHENAGKWQYEVQAATTYAYSNEWVTQLKKATALSAIDYQLLHTAYGHYIGEQINAFIEENQLQYKVQVIASHGHTIFHVPAKKMTAQLGDGAAIAAVTGINVVSELRAMDMALGGQGAPIVPIGEKLLLGQYPLFLNLGGIANLSSNHPEKYIAFDICPANRVLNMLAAKAGKDYDEGGALAASGTVNEGLLKMLNELQYYHMPYPKSLANDFGTDVVYPLAQKAGKPEDALRTYVEHIALQVRNAVQLVGADCGQEGKAHSLLVTGGGAHNSFLVSRLQALLQELNVTVEVPGRELIDFKEAIIMALIGVLRWREEKNVLSSVTGSRRDSIGGAVWIGQD